jgi:hypothetical protein
VGIEMGVALLGRLWVTVFGLWYRHPFSKVAYLIAFR